MCIREGFSKLIFMITKPQKIPHLTWRLSCSAISSRYVVSCVNLATGRIEQWGESE